MNEVYVIGAGASGLMAAIRAAELGARVTVYEAQSVEGKKLSATGNGKCNYTNMRMSPEAYHIRTSSSGWSGYETKMHFYECFKKFGNNDTISFFRSIGIEPLVKNEYVYPRSEQASSVVRALVRRCGALGVRIIRNHRVESIRELGISASKSGAAQGKSMIRDKSMTETKCTESDSFTESGSPMKPDKAVILACGSRAVNKSCNSYRLLEELGVSYSWVAPALCPIHCRNDDDFFKAAAGVRCPARIGAETGELQFTDYGLSGIVTFNQSHEIGLRISSQSSDVHSADTQVCRNSANKKNEPPNIYVDLLPELADEKAVGELLKERLGAMRLLDAKNPGCGNAADDTDISCKKRDAAMFGFKDTEELRILGDGLINSKLWDAIIDRMMRRKGQDIKAITIDRLAHELKYCGFTAYKTAGFDKCQVCSGGIGMDEIDPKTLQLRKHPGIYAAGEIIDMDGICGGYNLQWAWTSGYIAGTYAAGCSL